MLYNFGTNDNSKKDHDIRNIRKKSLISFRNLIKIGWTSKIKQDPYRSFYSIYILPVIFKDLYIFQAIRVYYSF